ncbi:MAG: VWA domain-containing protein [Desulfobacula sp.]|uniref:VWA domain-containing protein n=1 Tax=Desulfobacula sp. TaxID=2593537 RepID=UPI001D74B1CD|nr:VWA domain-containing protein [Desulfobacula sp.]MBT7794223.1 VWA domain-containing protein [Desulfobacula sp.]
MKFANPYLLNLLWGLIPLLGIMVYGILKRKKILAEFTGTNMIASLVPGFDPQKRWIKTSLIIISFGFAIVALSLPQWGYRWEKTNQKGVDIMIALDCSKSMLAQDIKPNRLERAKREIIDLLRMMKSDRAGLVAFSGRAILQCPLTLDHEAFNIFLKVLEPGYLPVGGTNLDHAIKEAYNGFEKESDTQKAIIIITDGESTSGDVEETAREMAKQGIKIFSIGVGSSQGAPIPDAKGGFKEDTSGNIILSKVDTKTLEKLAAMTGGTHVRSVAGDMDLDLIYKDKILGTMERKTLTSGKQKIWENRYQWFLFPCVVLLLIEFILSSKKRLRGLSIIVFAIGLSIFVFQKESVYAQSVTSSVNSGIKAFEELNYEQAKTHFIDAQLKDPENARLYYNIGVAAYMNNEFEQAKTNFMEAAKTKDIKLAHDARYNLANTYYRMEDFDEAIKEYEALLNNFPYDIQAKENLELARLKQEEQKHKETQSDKNKDNKENKDNKDDKENKEDQDNKQGQNPEKNQNNNEDKKDNNKDLDKKGQKEQDKPKEKQGKGNKPQDKPEKTSSESREDKASPEDKAPEQAQKILENMLNRLEDKPGGAMMPVLEKQNVEKDW